MYSFNSMSESSWNYCRERWESEMYNRYYHEEPEDDFDEDEAREFANCYNDEYLD